MGKYSELADSYYRLPDEVSAALLELEAERDRLREAHKRNIEDAVKGRYDEGHRCKWRILFEAVESRSRAALQEDV
jgi:hypothetical protein